MHSYESDKNKRIEIFHYSADHKLLTKAFYNSPDGQYKYINYVDMVVLGKEKVCVLAYAYNTRSSGGKASELVIANLKAGDSTANIKKLSFSKDLAKMNGIMKYNPVTKKIISVLIAEESSKRSTTTYATYLTFYNPAEEKLEYTGDLIPGAAIAKSAELYGDKKMFSGIPQNLYINKDGSFVVVFEEMSTAVDRSKGISQTWLGSIAASLYSITGGDLGSYFIPKNQFIRNEFLTPFYLADREKQLQKMLYGNQYKSFSYIDGLNKSYILMNDIAKNEEKGLKGEKLTTINSVGNCDAIIYELNGKDVIPARKYVFGEPGKKEHNLGLFAISDYDHEKNIYVTLRLAKEGRSKEVQLVWLQPQ